MTVTVWPDAAKAAIDYLEPLLAASVADYAAGVTVAQRVPKPRPAGPLVVVRRAGGLTDGYVLDRPRIDVQVWHADEFRAERLAALVRAHLLAARGETAGTAVVTRTADALGPTPIPDPESGQPRYLLTVEWTLRGAAT